MPAGPMTAAVASPRPSTFSPAWLLALGGAGLVPLLGGTGVAWALLMLAVMALGALLAGLVLEGRDLFAPAVLFPVAFVMYFGFGFMDLLVGHVPHWLWRHEALGLAGYLAGVWAVGVAVRRHLLRWPRPAPAAALRWRPVRWRLDAAVLATMAASAVATAVIVVQTGGPPLLHIDARHSVSAYLFVTAELGAVAAVWWNFDHWSRRGRVSAVRLAALAAMALLLALLAYRTPLMLLVLTAALGHHRIVRPLPLRRAAALLAVLAVFAGAFGWWRLQHTERYGGWERYLEKTNAEWTALEPFAPLMTTIREGSIVLGLLVEHIPSRHPHQGGAVTLSSVATILPGWQRGPREWIGLYARGKEHSTTPSILGFLYVDWGLPGIALGMAAFGAAIAWLYHLATARPSPLTLWLWAYASAVLLLGIHTGIADLSHAILAVYALGLTWVVHPRPFAWLARGGGGA